VPFGVIDKRRPIDQAIASVRRVRTPAAEAFNCEGCTVDPSSRAGGLPKALWLALVAVPFVGVAFLAAFFFLLPLQYEVPSCEAQLAENSKIARKRFAQLRAVDARLGEIVVDETPIDPAGPMPVFAARYSRYVEDPFGSNSRYRLEEAWNASLIPAEDLAFFREGTGADDFRADPGLAPLRYPEPFLFKAYEAVEGGAPDMEKVELERVLDHVRQMRYVLVVRHLEVREPEVVDDPTRGLPEFESGHIQGEALLFDLEAGQYLGGFAFEASNSEAVETRIEVTKHMRRDLRDDLRQQATEAIWDALDARLPGVGTPL